LILIQVFSVHSFPDADIPKVGLKVMSLEVEKESLISQGTDKFRFENSKFYGFAVRRGAPFNISVELNREIDLSKVEFGVSADNSEDVIFNFVTCHGIDTEKEPNEGFFYILEITTEADDPIGRHLDFALNVGDEGEKTIFTYPFPIYVLFNPYNSKDSAYMPDPEVRQSHLETEVSAYFQGEASDVEVDQWYFAQYEPIMLEAVFYLIEEAECNATVLKDPREVAKVLAHVLGYWTEPSPHQGNPHGILNGHWFDENFVNGTNPDDWRSSLDIVQQWYDNDKTPVSYAQCWIFACVGRSLYLSLGLVSRTVAGYSTMVDGSVIQYTNSLETHTFDDGMVHHVVMIFFDSKAAVRYQWGMVWNFHSWAEIYVSSNEEKEEYSGWHACDPTLPGNGPTPQRAIFNLDEEVAWGSSDFISDLHSTVVMKLVQCIPEVDAKKLPANTTTCPEVSTISVKARGAPLVLTEATSDPTIREDITHEYVDHTRDAFVALADGSKPYPEAMAQASLDHSPPPPASPSNPSSPPSSPSPPPSYSPPSAGTDESSSSNSFLGVKPDTATDFSLEIDTKCPTTEKCTGDKVRATIQITAPPQVGSSRKALDQALSYEVSVTGEMMRQNQPARLGVALQWAKTVVLSGSNGWSASLPVELPLAQALQLLGQERLGKHRMYLHLTVIARSLSGGGYLFDQANLLLTPPSPLRLSHEVPKHVAHLSLEAEASTLLKTGVAAPSHFTVHLTNPYPHKMENTCIHIKTLHFLALEIEGEECFGKIEEGESVTVSKPLKVLGLPAGDYSVSVMMTADDLPTFKSVRKVIVN